MDLVINRNDDGNGRIFEIREFQFSVFHVTFADLKITTDQVTAFGCEIQLSVFRRTKECIFHISENFTFSCALR